MVSSIDSHDEVDVFVGLDVGKGEHHAIALDRAGKRLFDKALPNDARRLRGVLDQLTWPMCLRRHSSGWGRC